MKRALPVELPPSTFSWAGLVARGEWGLVGTLKLTSSPSCITSGDLSAASALYQHCVCGKPAFERENV